VTLWQFALELAIEAAGLGQGLPTVGQIMFLEHWVLVLALGGRGW
jgi:hypothetical protein